MSRATRIAPAAALAATVLVAVGPIAEAAAQEGAPPPFEDPAAGGDAPSDEVPEVDFGVPERQGSDGDAPEAHRAVRRQLSASRLRLRHAEEVYDAVLARVAQLEGEVAVLEADVDALRADHRRAIRDLEEARDLLADRAASAYVRGGNLDGLSSVLESNDANDVGARTSMVRSVLDADEVAVDEYLAAREALTEQLRDTVDLLFERRNQLLETQASVSEVAAAVMAAQLELAAFEAGSEIAISGFRFPVAEPRQFGDSFGAARMPGTAFAHAHQGTDIFAPHGTPVLAVERGVITRMGTDILGGIKLWLLGESGTHYYYAHLTAYAPDLREGQLVEPGEVVGYVGDTGNARGTPPHLHFEIRPDGGAAINPYPLLAVTDELERRGGLA